MRNTKKDKHLAKRRQMWTKSSLYDCSCPPMTMLGSSCVGIGWRCSPDEEVLIDAMVEAGRSDLGGYYERYVSFHVYLKVNPSWMKGDNADDWGCPLVGPCLVSSLPSAWWNGWDPFLMRSHAKHRERASKPWCTLLLVIMAGFHLMGTNGSISCQKWRAGDDAVQSPFLLEVTWSGTP